LSYQNRIDQWWCCVTPGFRGLIQALALIRATFAAYVTLEDYQLLKLLVGGVSNEYRDSTLIAQLGLTPGVFIDPEGNQIDVLYFQLVYWAETPAFLLTPQAVCGSRCKLLTFPN